MERYDAVVVGAGPAGSSVALRLARAGRSVLLVDAARAFPRPKPCGEGLMPAGVSELRALGLWDGLAILGQPFHGIRYSLPDGTHAEARFPGGAQGWGFARRDLDARLLEAAREEPNATVRLGAPIRGFTRAESVRVRFDEGEVEAAVLVGADGISSTVRRLAGLDAPLPARPRFGVQAHLAHATRDPFVEVLLAEGHELYLTPVAPDVTNVALLCPATRLASFQGRLEAGLREALVRAPGPGAALARAPLLGRVRALGPLARQARAAHAERLLLVGDAAGALDPITGEGVALSLVTGAIACDVLGRAFAANDFSAARLSGWSARRAAEVRGLSRLTALLLSLADRPWLARRVVRNLSRAPRTFERLLGVASGHAPLHSLSLRDGVAMLLGV